MPTSDFGDSRHGILPLIAADEIVSSDLPDEHRQRRCFGFTAVVDDWRKWRITQLMQRKLHQVMRDRKLQYSLSGLVEEDDALPEIVLGLNQTLMFGLFMVMIAGSIGTVDLSQGIFRALTFNYGGKGLGIGLCVVFIGLTADRLLVEWAERRK